MHNFRASIGMSVHHFKLDNERIPLLPVLYVQLGEGKGRVLLLLKHSCDV